MAPSSSSSSSSPVGLEIVKGKRRWKVGSVLGRGACATVCSLEKVRSSSSQSQSQSQQQQSLLPAFRFAIKLAPLPTKTTKKGNSRDETNAKLLYYEQMIYTTQFRSLQGSILPRVPNFSAPSDPPLYGDANGFRYFVMERMDTTISAIVPLLLQNQSQNQSKSKTASKTAKSKTTKNTKNNNSNSNSNSTVIHVGPIATKNIIRDVKTENFMLAMDDSSNSNSHNCNTGNSNGKLSFEERLASRIRLIDLAIATQWTTMYCEDDGNNNAGSSGGGGGGTIVGTPLYASLNVHAGKKSGFRDDLESLGYVLAELLIQLASGGGGGLQQSQQVQLPWSGGTSDDDVWERKKQAMLDDGEFYRALGDASTARVVSRYMNTVRSYGFKTVPDYDELSEILSGLTVTVPAAAASKSAASKNATSKSAASKTTKRGAAATTTAKRTRTTASSTSASASINDNDSNNEHAYASPPKMLRRSTRNRTRNTNTNAATRNSNSNSTSMMIIDVSSDPVEEEEEVVVEQQSTADENDVDQSFDETVYADAHQDINEMDWEYTNTNDNHNDDENEQPVVQDKDEDMDSKPSARSSTRSRRHAAPARQPRATRSNNNNNNNNATEVDAEERAPTGKSKSKSRSNPELKRRGILLVCTEGPHKGETHELEAGVCDTVFIGSDPTTTTTSGTGTGRATNTFSLPNDKGVKKTHVRLDLSVNRKLTAVKITDKSNGGETRVNRDKVKNTKAFIHDVITIGETSIAIRAL
eukprot:jgi/Psemu1/12707/gm1.12707_g